MAAPNASLATKGADSANDAGPERAPVVEQALGYAGVATLEETVVDPAQGPGRLAQHVVGRALEDLPVEVTDHPTTVAIRTPLLPIGPVMITVVLDGQLDLRI